jgi:glycine/D-amino acid oxidase-like deaminating enzyme
VRSSYGERDWWIRWANEAIARWKAWDQEWSERLRLRLFFPTGDLILRPEPEPWLADTLRNWELLRVPHEVLTLDEVAYRYPQISLEGMTLAAFETNAGVVRARRVCETVREMFRPKGGKIGTCRQGRHATPHRLSFRRAAPRRTPSFRLRSLDAQGVARSDDGSSPYTTRAGVLLRHAGG